MTFEYVGQTIGSKDVGGARARDRHRRAAALPGRRAGEGRAAAVPDRSEALPGAARIGARPRSRAHRREKARAEREVARLQSARRAQGDRPEGGRRRAVAGASSPPRRLKAAEAKATEARLNLSYTRVTAPIAGVTEPRAAIGRQPRHRERDAARRRSRRSIRCGSAFSIVGERALEARARASPKAGSRCRTDNGYRRRGQARRRLASSRAPAASISSDTRINPQTGTSEMRATSPTPTAR